MSPAEVRAFAVGLVLIVGCSGASPRGPDSAPDGADPADAADAIADADAAPPAEPIGVISTALRLDVAGLRGHAEITHGPAETIVLEAAGLSDLRVTDASGAAVAATITDGIIRLPGRAEADTTYVFDYAFAAQPAATLRGWVPSEGVTFLWPYFCQNLFPCVSSPRDGTTFTLAVEGLGADVTAVYPTSIPSPAPSYMLAVAVGDYQFDPLGTTSAGTDVGVYYFTGEGASAHEGTDSLVAVIDFYERTYGPYLFGDEIASVAATWGPSGGLGGMEHHPYFHVARPSMASAVVQAHEAAHGWYGNGVRIRCWEDFVLSEGVTTYLASRGLAAAAGPTSEAEVWDGYATDLRNAISRGDTEAWPTGCDAIDILGHPIWSSIPYTKGAFFLRAVELEVGRDTLDRVLSEFYMRHGGAEAASMGDLIAALEARTGFDTSELVDVWLRGRGLPPLPPLP